MPIEATFRLAGLISVVLLATLAAALPAWPQSRPEVCVNRAPLRCERVTCRAGEREVSRDPLGLLPGDPRVRECLPFSLELVRCCRRPPDCAWRGTAPLCAGECERGETRLGPSARSSGSRRQRSANAQAAARGLTVSGFGGSCLTGTKVLCCLD
jgi:hypothetical protein